MAILFFNSFKKKYKLNFLGSVYVHMEYYVSRFLLLKFKMKNITAIIYDR